MKTIIYKGAEIIKLDQPEQHGVRTYFYKVQNIPTDFYTLETSLESCQQKIDFILREFQDRLDDLRFGDFFTTWEDERERLCEGRDDGEIWWTYQDDAFMENQKLTEFFIFRVFDEE